MAATDSRTRRIWRCFAGAGFLLISALPLSCAKSVGKISWPSSVPTQSLSRSSTPGQVLSHQLGRLPESFAAAAETNVAQGQDSLFLFYLIYPSRQGTVAAFQEWLQVADRGKNQSPLKGIGKRAVEFESGLRWILFYTGKAVFGVGHPQPVICRSIARTWAGEQDK